MKKIVFILTAILSAWAMSSCQQEKILYEGDNFFLFTDTLSIYPVTKDNAGYKVSLGATKACPYDRTIGVMVDVKSTDAIEGKHFTLNTNSVTIPAGKLSAEVTLLAPYDRFEFEDTLSVTLKLVSVNDEISDLYGAKTKVRFKKVAPFDINDYVGDCLVSSSFFDQYMYGKMRLTTSEIVEGEENTILIHDFYSDGYDVKISFKDDDPLKQYIYMDDFVVGWTPDIFNMMHGDGKLWGVGEKQIPSFYVPQDRIIAQYMNAYVNEMVYRDPVTGQESTRTETVGIFLNVVKWLTEAEKEELEGSINIMNN